METIMNVYAWYLNFADQLPAWVNAMTTFIAGASALTMLTPTTWDNKIVNWISKALNFISMNVIKNKNADDAS